MKLQMKIGRGTVLLFPPEPVEGIRLTGNYYAMTGNRFCWGIEIGGTPVRGGADVAVIKEPTLGEVDGGLAQVEIDDRLFRFMPFKEGSEVVYKLVHHPKPEWQPFVLYSHTARPAYDPRKR